MTERKARAGEDPAAQQQVVAGLVAAPGLPLELAEDLAHRLPAVLAARAPGVRWAFVVRPEPLVGTANIDVDLVQQARERMLAEGWQFAICLTDLPVRVGHRPVTAFASRALDVGVVSVPAFGAIDLEDRVLQAVLYLVGELDPDAAASEARQPSRPGTHRRSWWRRRLDSAVGRRDVPEQDSVRFVTAASVGNMRLLLGMVRANRPWRLIIGLSRVLVAAAGTAAFGLTAVPLWWVGDAMSWPRLLAIGLVAASLICAALVVGHRLWERPQVPAARERVMLVNLATTLTVALGVLTLLAALLVVTMLCAKAVLLQPVLEQQLGHPLAIGGYIRIAWLVSALAMLGGALGATLETDVTVREAAYGYRAADDPGGRAPAPGTDGPDVG
jgi:hypothetical protein